MFGCGGGPKNVIMDQSGRTKKNQSDSGQAPKIFFSGRVKWGKRKWGKGGKAVRVASEAGTGDVKKVSEEHNFCSTTGDRAGKFLDSI